MSMIECCPGENERQAPSITDVLIVGAGLSGLSLASALMRESNISFTLIDLKAPHQPKEAMYLVSSHTAEKWGLHLSNKTRISGSITFDPQGKIIDSIGPLKDESGYQTVAQGMMEKFLGVDPRRIFYQTTCQRVWTKDDIVQVETSQGLFQSHLVIDATGWEGNVIHSAHGQEEYPIVAIYGGNYRTSGFDPRMLHLIRGIQNNNCNWVMPIHDHGAEIAAAQYVSRVQAPDWWRRHAEREFSQMVTLYERNGKSIIKGKKNHALAFRVAPAGRKYFMDTLVIPFGESAGLNSPLVGQLSDTLLDYANVMAEAIADAKKTNNLQSVGERFYQTFITHPPYAYLIHSILRENNLRMDKNTHATPNRFLVQALRNTFDEYTQWKLLQENGVGPTELLMIVKRSPIELMSWILSSTPSLLTLICTHPDLYLQLFLSFRSRLMRKNWDGRERYYR